VRDTEACKNNHDRTTHVKPTRTTHEPQVDLNVVSDRYMQLHGGNILGQAHHVAAATDDDGSVCSANERKNDATKKSPVTFLLLLNRLSIDRPLASFPPPPLLLLSPTSEPTVPDVNMCRSNLKRSKTKHCVILGVRIAYFKKLPCSESATRYSKVTHVAVYSTRYIKYLCVCGEGPNFFSLDVPMR
jgi:hypothetical protein